MIQWNIYQACLDPVLNSEQAGTRPVLIISSDAYNKNMSLISVLPITSRKPDRKIYSNEVFLAKGTGGLPVDSIALIHQIRTISKNRIGKHYGMIQDKNIKKQIQFGLINHFTLMEYFIDI
ncbi:MAG TPA: type II toxin-antitoxin system PemK/MazF family toxin [Candidatus Eremiobacteraeota bacterium]|nr:MAG: mRNA interferase MazF [bacterium ADurb.Bin363]HPZ09945.1 type II toxin-antitoxin system PemK/MazF family toxin [Candidatus Eremiobacteraeota bacterium]